MLNQPARGNVTRPLLNRPQSAAPPPAPPPQSFLGNAIAGALGGMGYMPPQQPHVPYWGQQQQPYGAYPPPQLPQNPQLAYAPSFGSPQGGAYGYPQHPPPPYYQQQNYQMQQMNYSYGQQQQQQPSNNFHRTTAEGYSISSSYVPPPSSTPLGPGSQPRQSNSNRNGGNSGYSGRGRGGGGGGRGGGGRDRGPPRQGPNHRAPHPSQGDSTASTSTAASAPALPTKPHQQKPQRSKCGQEGCGFEGSAKMVREHEEDRHLLFQPGREPKPWTGTLKPPLGVFIEGTSLALDSPEAIAKWIEDRKKKWPSNKVVGEKEKLRAERIAAGLEAPSWRGGRGGARGGRSRGKGRDREWGQPLGGERTAKRIKLDSADNEASSSDSSSSSSDSDSSDSDSGSEDIDEVDDEDDGPPEEVSSSKPVAEESSRAPGKPVIHPSRLLAEDANSDTTATPSSTQPKRFQVVCKHWRKGQCNLGENCPYLHTLPPQSTAPPAATKRKRPAPPAPPRNPFSRPDVFAALAERDIQHVVSDVMQVIEFLGNNNWLKGVETRIGELEEEGGIEVLGSGEDQSVKRETDGEIKREIQLQSEDLKMDGEEGQIELHEEKIPGHPFDDVKPKVELDEEEEDEEDFEDGATFCFGSAQAGHRR
ncbi:hypothetical protein T439DRAFT_323604 [Meredithblackwellia eburnea MCA 4105]